MKDEDDILCGVLEVARDDCQSMLCRLDGNRSGDIYQLKVTSTSLKEALSVVLDRLGGHEKAVQAAAKKALSGCSSLTSVLKQGKQPSLSTLDYTAKALWNVFRVVDPLPHQLDGHTGRLLDKEEASSLGITLTNVMPHLRKPDWREPGALALAVSDVIEAILPMSPGSLDDAKVTYIRAVVNPHHA